MGSEAPVHVLVVAHRTAATPALLAAIHDRANRSPCRFSLVVPNGVDGLFPGRRQLDWKHSQGEAVLALALPLMEEAAGAPVDGWVSTVPNPFDVVQVAVEGGDVDEIIISTLPHRVSHWLRIDLPARVADLRLPVTVVVAQHEARVPSH
jgi:hypothetical protein